MTLKNFDLLGCVVSCLVACIWLFAAIASMATSCAILAAAVFGAYYLATGEFLF